MFIHNEPCPRCRERGHDRSGNNLGVWSDHKRCWACSYYENTGNSLESIKQQFHTVEKNNKNGNNFDLPADCNTHVRLDALTWLRKYGIRDYEMERHHTCFSYQKELLVFPIYDGYLNLLMWCGRYFGKNKEYPKYIIKGYKNDVMHILGEKSSTLILTEDLISSIKISRTYQAMPIWGAHVSTQMLDRIKKLGITRLAIWLDENKAKESLQFSKKASIFFDSAVSIVTPLDPKEYNDAEIREHISKSLP